MTNHYLSISMNKTTNIPEHKVIVSKPKKKQRCHYCSKKLKLTELNFTCKCDHTFCLHHFNPHSHKCSFDYLKERQAIIKENNPKMCIQVIEVK